MNNDLVNVLIGLAIGLSTAIVVEIVRYRNQKRILMIQRLTPLIEKMLGCITRIIKNGEDAKVLDGAFRQYSESEKSNEPYLIKGVKKALFEFSQRGLRSLKEDAIEFESVYSELLKTGMLETIRTNNQRLYTKIGCLHGCTETFSGEKIDSLEEAMTLSHTLVHNTVLFAKDCEKPLREFINS